MSAIQNLQEQIEAIRREADAEGYARAWREIAVMAAARGGAGAPAAPSAPAEPQAAEPLAPPAEDSPKRRAPRGSNREAVLDVLNTFGSKMGATEIQRNIGNIAYSSVRHALAQLVEAGKVLEFDGGLFQSKEEADRVAVARAATVGPLILPTLSLPPSSANAVAANVSSTSWTDIIRSGGKS